MDLEDAIGSEPHRPELEPVLKIAADLAKELDREDPPTLKKILRTLIDRLNMESRALIRPVFRVPLVRVMGS